MAKHKEKSLKKHLRKKVKKNAKLPEIPGEENRGRRDNL